MRYPTIAQMARKYLSICGTSVPSERMFSLSGHIASDSCNRLLPVNVNKLVFWQETCTNSVSACIYITLYNRDYYIYCNYSNNHDYIV